MYSFFKKLRAITLDRLKKIIEIFAILAAGLFAFSTWGLDYITVSKPNWNISIINTNQYLAVENDSLNLLFATKDLSKDFISDSATSFIYQGTLEIKNNGNRVIYIRESKIDVFFLKRIESKGFVNTSLYEYYLNTINETHDHDLHFDFELNEIDNSPIYPGNPGTRSFAFEVNPSKLAEVNMPLHEFSRKYVMLLIGTQKIETIGFFYDRSMYSKASNLVPNISFLRTLKVPKPSVNQDQNKESKTNYIMHYRGI